MRGDKDGDAFSVIISSSRMCHHMLPVIALVIFRASRSGSGLVCSEHGKWLMSSTIQGSKPKAVFEAEVTRSPQQPRDKCKFAAMRQRVAHADWPVPRLL